MIWVVSLEISAITQCCFGRSWAEFSIWAPFFHLRIATHSPNTLLEKRGRKAFFSSLGTVCKFGFPEIPMHWDRFITLVDWKCNYFCDSRREQVCKNCTQNLQYGTEHDPSENVAGGRVAWINIPVLCASCYLWNESSILTTNQAIVALYCLGYKTPDKLVILVMQGTCTTFISRRDFPLFYQNLSVTPWFSGSVTNGNLLSRLLAVSKSAVRCETRFQ